MNYYVRVEFPDGDTSGHYTVKQLLQVPRDIRGLNLERVTAEPGDDPAYSWQVVALLDNRRKTKQVLFEGEYDQCSDVFDKVEERVTSGDPLYRNPSPAMSDSLPDTSGVGEIETREGLAATEAIQAPVYSRIREVPDGWYRVRMGGESSQDVLAPVGWEAHYSQGVLFLQPPGFDLQSGHWVPLGYEFDAGVIVRGASYPDRSDSVEDMKKEVCENLSRSSDSDVEKMVSGDSRVEGVLDMSDVSDSDIESVSDLGSGKSGSGFGDVEV